jgi:hypothetical protein
MQVNQQQQPITFELNVTELSVQTFLKHDFRVICKINAISSINKHIQHKEKYKFSEKLLASKAEKKEAHIKHGDIILET